MVDHEHILWRRVKGRHHHTIDAPPDHIFEEDAFLRALSVCIAKHGVVAGVDQCVLEPTSERRVEGVGDVGDQQRYGMGAT
jgi:hypothetical protein